MPYTYFALGTTLANMANVETWVDIPAHILEEGPAALLGPVREEALSGKSRREGAIPHAWRFDFESMAQWRTLVYQATGAFFTVQSREVYISTIDVSGYYSPFRCYVEQPYPQDNYRLSEGRWVRDIVVPFTYLRLQSVTKTSNYTVTASDRLIYVDTSGGSCTMTLPAANTVTPNTVYSFQKTSASNNLVLDGDGSELVDGATTKTLTALNARADIVSDGAAWTSIVA